jgi:hypothetical protein
MSPKTYLIGKKAPKQPQLTPTEFDVLCAQKKKI